MAEAWQFRSPLDCHRYMLEHGIATDVTFVVSNKIGDSNQGTVGTGEVRTFKAHRFPLMSRSPIFFAMFDGNQNTKEDIIVEDVEPDAFKEMLSYIYTDRIDLQPDLAVPLIYVAGKYLLPALTKMCVEYCVDTLAVDNACSLRDHSLAQNKSFVEQQKNTAMMTTPTKAGSHQNVWVLRHDMFKTKKHSKDYKDIDKQIVQQGIILPGSEKASLPSTYLKNQDKDTFQPNLYRPQPYLVNQYITIKSDAGLRKVHMNSVSNTTFTVSTNRNISISEMLLGRITPGFCEYSSDTFTYFGRHRCESNITSMVYLDGQNYPIMPDTCPGVLTLKKPMILDKGAKYSLRIQLRETKRSNMGCVLRRSFIEKANISELNMFDRNTGVTLKLTTGTKHMFLIGFEYCIT